MVLVVFVIFHLDRLKGDAVEGAAVVLLVPVVADADGSLLLPWEVLVAVSSVDSLHFVVAVDEATGEWMMMMLHRVVLIAAAAAFVE